MDLYSGTPWWIIKNKLYHYYNPVREDIKVPVAVIGSGITGALVAHELCECGIGCCVIDKRSVASGSSSASTALLQYEIDVPLYQMIDEIGENHAVIAYRSCLQSISDLENIFQERGLDVSFERVPSIYLASNRKGLDIIKKEYIERIRQGLPVEYLPAKEVKKQFGIKAPGALMNRVSAQVDTYKAAVSLLNYNLEKKLLHLYSHTEIIRWKKQPEGYLLETSEGKRIECEYVIIATGFEASRFLPEKLMNLTSTFAIISEPVDADTIWPERSLIWETREPYLYIRTDNQNRIIVGGEDIPYNSRIARKFLLDQKAVTLEKKFKKMFPEIPFKTEMTWAGTFSSTKDGLPLIGSTSDDPRMLFALGYGGNGITFSVIAAQILANCITGIGDSREKVFSLERPSLK